MTTRELYTKGARVWIPHKELVWQAGVLLSDIGDDGVLIVELEEAEDEEDEIFEIDTSKKPDALPPLRNPEILIGENDLTTLSYLHEPAVLYNLQVRFLMHNAIYTYSGIVLVAINPYEQLPLYGPDIIAAYSGQTQGDMDPHIFAVAEEAYRTMARHSQNQSLIVSGESGAGKTVSAKYAMRYFATVGGADAETQIEKKVLASNPIMESIGNAKTIRNDNSSRFGKYIQIFFDKNHHIIGAHMRTYLLEKSRVVFQAPEERNYHIFYQLCASCDLPELKELRLGDPEEFWYLAQGQAPMIDGVDDAETFEEMRESLDLVDITEEQQRMIFRILAAVLHLGNVVILPGENEDESGIEEGDISLEILTDLLGIDKNQLQHWLCNRKIVAMREVLIKPLNQKESLDAREALSKHIYSQLFQWIVKAVNKTLSTGIKHDHFIGVLDIYGFETFEVNSFEQFCINFANEKLQQQFTQHVFKLEQEEYVREKIEWSFINFYDNQPCIDMIQSKLGILDLLDEECKMPKGSDEQWARKIFQRHLGKSRHLSKPRMSNMAFIIEHFADMVKYDVNGFLEKNRDTVNEEHLAILRASEYELVAELFTDESSAEPATRSRMKMPPRTEAAFKGHKNVKSKQSVGSQFSTSLNKLMETLNSTTPHYVRCIKPNDLKEPFEFDPSRVMQQLRACGVLETVKISAAGYPSRWTYADFFHRYRMLIKFSDVNWKSIKDTCDMILTLTIKDPDKFQCGKTKIFFRAGQVAYMEKLRSDKLRDSCITIQKNFRGWFYYRKYQEMRRAAILIQSWIRGRQARSLAKFLRRTKAAICIQRNFRGFVMRKRYTTTRHAAVTIQSYYRGMVARRIRMCLLYDAKARVIQRTIRRYAARKNFIKKIKSIIYLQCCVRRMYARREFKKLKIEARSVEHYKTVTKGMENKIISLQRRLDEEVRVKEQLLSKQKNVDEMQHELSNVKQLKSEHRKALTLVTELENVVSQLEADLEAETNEKEAILEKYETEKSEKLLETGRMKKEIAELTEEVEYAVEKADKGKATIEVLTLENKKLKDEKAEISRELELEQGHRQRLIMEYERLKQRYDNLHEEMQIVQSPVKTPTKSKSMEASFAAELIKDGAVFLSPQEKLQMDESAATISSLKEQIKNLQNEKEITLSKDNRKLNLELASLNRTIEGLYAEREADKELIDEADTTIESLRRQIRDLEVERDAFKNKLHALGTQGIIPNIVVENIETAVEKENEKRRKQELNEWEEKLKEKERERLHKEKKEHREREEKARIEAFEQEERERLHELEMKQNVEREEIYNNKIKELLAENKRISDELFVLQNVVKELEVECDTTLKKLDVYEGEMQVLRQQVRDIEVERDAYRSKLSGLESQGVIPTIIIETIENEVEQLNEDRRKAEMIEWEEKLKQKEIEREEKSRKEQEERDEKAKQVAVENEEKARRDEKNLEKIKTLMDENKKINGQIAVLQRLVASHNFEREMDRIKDIKLSELSDEKDLLLNDNDRLKHELIKVASIAPDIINMDMMNYDAMDENAYFLHINTLKQANGVLQRELEVMLKKDKTWRDKNDKLLKDLEESGMAFSKGSSSVQLDTSIQKELSRLVEENLALQEQIEKLEQQIKQLEKELQDEQVGEVVWRPRSASVLSKGDTEQRRRGQSFLSGRPQDLKAGKLVMTYAGLLRKHTKTDEDLLPPPPPLKILGMVEYTPEDEEKLIDRLIDNLTPAMVADQIPGLPAHILFMCIRHADRQNDDRSMQSLVTNAINAIKKVTKKNQHDLDILAFWLANSCRLVHDMKQYSGEAAFKSHNTPEQNEQCLDNFDLTQYRQVLSDTAITTYQDLVKCVWDSINTMIVAGMLEYESIPGVTSSKPMGRKRASSKADPNTLITVKTITKQLSHVLAILNTHCVDPDIIKQIFRQVFYNIGSNMMNNLLLRKDMCHWSKGMQIRFNLSQLEDWVRVNQLEGGGIVEALECITQAAQLLQVNKKTLEDVNAICEVCSSLNTLQVQKILNMYTPANEYEARVPAKVIRAVVARGHNKVDPMYLMMDVNHQFSINIPFTPSAVTLDTIHIPQTLGLNFIKVV